MLGLAHLALGGQHLAVDRLQLGQRQRGAGLDVDQLLLVRLEVGQGTRHGGAVRTAFGHQCLAPGKVGFIAGEARHDVLARHPAALDQQLQHLALDDAHGIDHRLHIGAQALDGLRGEADRAQFFADRVPGGQEDLRLGAIRRLFAAHYFELRGHARKALQAFVAQLRHVGVGAGLLGRAFVGIVFVAAFVVGTDAGVFDLVVGGGG
ncbi:hypothetical protein D9M69_269510 [compost metagenome]